MNKKKIRKWAICGGVFIGGIAIITLMDAPNLAPIVVGIAVALSFTINSEEDTDDTESK